MKNNFYLEKVKAARKDFLKLNKKQLQHIRNLYIDAASELTYKSSMVNKESLSHRWLTDYRRSVQSVINMLTKQLFTSSKKGISNSAQLGIKPQIQLFEAIKKRYNIDVTNSFTSVLSFTPDEVLSEIIKANFYQDGRSLSKRIWINTNKTHSEIEYMIQRAIAEKKSAYQLTKDIEKYVNPSSKKDFQWNKVYPNIGNKQVDYNAQRLARTSINHAYWLSNVKSSEKNPFVDAMHWELSASHLARQVAPFGEDECDVYANQNNYRLGKGNFPVDELPLPHPNCLCSQWSVIGQSLEEIGEDLGSWIRGSSNPKLDMWFEKFGKEFAA